MVWNYQLHRKIMIQHSYWEKTTFLSGYDVIIIGGGIVGLTSAILLKTKNPKLKIGLVERGYLPIGASTRNAGFACFGSLSELLRHETEIGTEKLLNLIEFRYSGLKKLLSIVDANKIDYHANGNYEIFTEKDTSILSRCHTVMHQMNKFIEHKIGEKEVYQSRTEMISQFKLSNVKDLIFNQAEGELHSGKLIAELFRIAVGMGVFPLSGLNITSIEENSMGTRLLSENGLIIESKKTLVATNAFAKSLIPDLDIRPGRGQVLITKPIPNLKLNGCFHYESGYYYFRNLDGRLLIGGGRHHDFKGEETTNLGTTAIIQEKIEDIISTVILQNEPYEVDMRWSGIMAFGDEIYPTIKEVRPGVFCAVKMSGMGVAIGSSVADQVSDMIIQSV